MPVNLSSPYAKSINRAARARTGPTKKQIAAAKRAAVVLRSALDAATERALRERTPESRRCGYRASGSWTSAGNSASRRQRCVTT